MPCENKHGPHVTSSNASIMPLALASSVVACRLLPVSCRGFACSPPANLQGVVLSRNATGTKPGHTGPEGPKPEPEGLYAARIMAVTAGRQLAWPRRWPARLAWALWVLIVLGLAATPSLDQLARQAGRTDLGSNATMVAYGLVAVSAATVGALLGGRRPRHLVGWLLLALGLWFAYGYASWVLLAWRGAPPAVGLAILDANVMVIPALIGFVLLLTPTGSLPSPRWRWWARVAATAPLLGLGSLALGRSGRQTCRSPTRSPLVPWLVHCW